MDSMEFMFMDGQCFKHSTTRDRCYNIPAFLKQYSMLIIIYTLSPSHWVSDLRVGSRLRVFEHSLLCYLSVDLSLRMEVRMEFTMDFSKSSFN